MMLMLIIMLLLTIIIIIIMMIIIIIIIIPVTYIAHVSTLALARLHQRSGISRNKYSCHVPIYLTWVDCSTMWTNLSLKETDAIDGTRTATL